MGQYTETAVSTNSYLSQISMTEARSHTPITNLQGQVSFNTIPCDRNPKGENPGANYVIPDFLLQLTKMLTDENRSVIEWSNGKIEVHNPPRLEATILPKYFRSSKFASFQRQLNYFHFRKVAGKGKMAPCTYFNDETTSDIQSLYGIKRKKGRTPRIRSSDPLLNNSRKRRAISLPLPTTNIYTNYYNEQSFPTTSSASQLISLPNSLIGVDSIFKRDQIAGSEGCTVTNCTVAKGVHRQFGYQAKSNIKEKEIENVFCDKVNESPLALARTVVGKGVRHNYVMGSLLNNEKSINISSNEQNSKAKSDAMPFLDPYLLGFEPQVFDEISPAEPNQNYICEVQRSFKESKKLVDTGCVDNNDSSLVELAMIPSLVDKKGTPDLKFEQISNHSFDSEASTS